VTRFDRSDDILFQATDVTRDVDLTPYVKECSVRYDLSHRVSEATLSLTSWPPGVQYWDYITVWAGLAPRVPSGPDDPATHGGLERFAGYVWDPSFDLWTPRATMLARGPLILADRMRVPTDEELDAVSSPPLTVDYSAPGIDMSRNPDTSAAWRGQDMITWALTKSGLAAKIGPIGGTDHILGSAAFDQFVWRRQESALQFVEKLDAISMGYRTYDAMPCTCADPVKNVLRTRIDMLPDVENVVCTFWEGRDLFAGSSLQRAPSLIRNCVRVEGWNPGTGPMVYVATGAHPVPPADWPVGVTYLDTETISSGLIELDLPPDPQTYDQGISAKEIADWTLAQRLHDWWTMTAVTWRDDPITAGNSIYVNAPHLGGDLACNQAWWVQAVEVTVGPGSFRQRLNLRAPKYWGQPT
jgi:hypothetical protein